MHCSLLGKVWVEGEEEEDERGRKWRRRVEEVSAMENRGRNMCC